MFVRPRTAIAAGLVCVAGLAFTGVLAYLVPVTQNGDAGALDGYVDLADGRFHATLAWLVHLADPAGYAKFALALIVVALLRRRYRLAAMLPVVIVMAPLMTEQL